jgi:hypothetical protein
MVLDANCFAGLNLSCGVETDRLLASGSKGVSGGLPSCWECFALAGNTA